MAGYHVESYGGNPEMEETHIGTITCALGNLVGSARDSIL